VTPGAGGGTEARALEMSDHERRFDDRRGLEHALAFNRA